MLQHGILQGTVLMPTVHRMSGRIYLLAMPTEEEREQHIDIADWLIKWKLDPRPATSSKMNRTFQKVAKFFSPEFHEQLLALIEDLDLEVWDLPQH